MFERKFGGWSFEIKNDSTLESENRLHFRYLSKTMGIFFVGIHRCIRRAREVVPRRVSIFSLSLSPL